MTQINNMTKIQKVEDFQELVAGAGTGVAFFGYSTLLRLDKFADVFNAKLHKCINLSFVVREAINYAVGNKVVKRLNSETCPGAAMVIKDNNKLIVGVGQFIHLWDKKVVQQELRDFDKYLNRVIHDKLGKLSHSQLDNCINVVLSTYYPKIKLSKKDKNTLVQIVQEVITQLTFEQHEMMLNQYEKGPFVHKLIVGHRIHDLIESVAGYYEQNDSVSAICELMDKLTCHYDELDELKVGNKQSPQLSAKCFANDIENKLKSMVSKKYRKYIKVCYKPKVKKVHNILDYCFELQIGERLDNNTGLTIDVADLLPAYKPANKIIAELKSQFRNNCKKKSQCYLDQFIHEMLIPELLSYGKTGIY